MTPEDGHKTADGQYECFTDTVWNGEFRSHSCPATEEGSRRIVQSQ